MQKILRDHYQIEHPQIVTGKCGKPRLETEKPCFNLSHSGNMTAVAVGDTEVGLDIQLRTARDYSAIKRRLSPEEQKEDFFRVWTAKEAYVKYLGGTLAELYASLRFFQNALYLNGERAEVSLCFRETEEYVLCLCTALPCATVELIEL